MDDGLKQRLIGAIVLVAIGVIFIPSLLNEDGRREVDISTQVPPEPVVMPRPLDIPDPLEPDNLPAPKVAEENYAHIEAPQSETQENAATTEPEPEPVSGLNEDGVPRAWSIQVSSFESEKNAETFEQKLKDANYTAYIRSSVVNGNKVYRVYVGPKINYETAEKTKTEIDKTYKTKSLLIEFKP